MMQQHVNTQLKENVDIPIMMAPMFLISNPEMVINACGEGVIGTFPALNARTSSILEDWMEKINTEIERMKKDDPAKKVAPWGINYIVHRSNKRYKEDFHLIEKYQPPIVITSLGDPGPIAEVVHGYGGMVFSDVINIKFAKKAVEKGADGLVLVSVGAGGHAGTYNPISFVHEVREFFSGPLVLSGGMTRGEDVLVTELLGADYAYFGTRFIPATESSAEEAYKEMVTDTSIEDIIFTDAFTGVHANYMIPSITGAGLDPATLTTKENMDFSELQDKDVKAWKDIWGAGQGVGSIHNVQPVAEIIQELKTGYLQAIKRTAEKDHGHKEKTRR